MSPRGEGLVAINLTALLLGATALFGKIDASPVWIVLGRCLFASAALFLMLRVRGRKLRARRSVVIGAAATAALLALHWIAFFTAIQWSGVGLAIITVSSFPLFTVLLEGWSKKRALHWLEVVAGAAMIGAIALVAAPSEHQGSLVLWGMGLGVFAAASYAVFALFSQRLLKEVGPSQLSCLQYGFVVLWLAPFLPFSTPLSGADDWFAIVALGVVFTAIAHQLYLFALTRLSASACAGFICLEPIYAIGYAALFFRDAIPPTLGISAAIIAIACWILLRRNDEEAQPAPLDVV